MAAGSLSQRKKWGIALITWPFAAFFLSLIAYAVVNWGLPSTDLASSAGVGIVNVILFIIGAASIFLGLPSLIVGIVLLATGGETAHAQAASQHRPAKKGLSIAGMVLGISSLLLWFFGFIPAVLAIIFSAIGLKKEQAKGMAVAGLVTGIVGVILSIFIFIVSVTIAYSGVTERANDSAIQADAAAVAKYAELYAADYGYYPNYAQMEQQLAGTGVEIYPQGEGLGGDVVFIPCYGEGAIIWYWSNDANEYLVMNVGTSDVCEWNE